MGPAADVGPMGPADQWRTARLALAQLDAACRHFSSVWALSVRMGEVLTAALGDTPGSGRVWVPWDDGLAGLWDAAAVARQASYLAFARVDDVVREFPFLKADGGWFRGVRDKAVGVAAEAEACWATVEEAVRKGGWEPPLGPTLKNYGEGDSKEVGNE